MDGKPSPSDIEALKRLCSLLSLPSATADLIAAAMLEAQAPLPGGAAPAPADGAITVRPLPLMLPQDLYGVRGIDPQAAAKLIPYVAILLTAPTPINVNTATAEVIAARVGISLSAARALVTERERIGYFLDVADFRKRLPNQGADLDILPAQIGTQSSYFLIRGQVKLDRATERMEALVRRPAVNQVVQVLWQREL
jgi:general secretion pathway protein K